MPGFRGHLVGGAATFGLLSFVGTKLGLFDTTKIIPVLVALSAALLGSLFPDIDIGSKGQRIFFTLVTVIATASLVSERWDIFALLVVLFAFTLVIRHRGIMHKTLFVICAPLAIPFAVINYEPRLSKIAILFYIFFVAGALSHLVLDFGLKKLR